MPKIHDLSDYSDGEAYDLTQCRDDIKDGDVLVLARCFGGNKRSAVLMGAWPVMVVGDSEECHHLAEGVTWDTLDGGKYAESAKLAREAVA